MSKGNVIVQGAMCKCKFGNVQDTLVVNTQNKVYMNDDKGSQKLAASTMYIGMPLQAKTFGQCKLQPSSGGFLTCVPAVTQWQDTYENVVLPNKGNILTEKSKATCAIAGSTCIEFTWDGQTGSPTSSNVSEKEEKVLSQLNPLATANYGTNYSSCFFITQLINRT